MNTAIEEIEDGIHRISTFVPDAGLSFNQFLIAGEEPFLFHTGLRMLFPAVSEAVATVIPLETLRWISFGHVEADECGSVNKWLDAAPSAEVAFGAIGCMTSVGDLADRAPRALDDGEVIDTGGKRLRWIATPHVPHGWEAGVFYEEVTGTLLCGDLFTRMGDGPAATEESPVEAAQIAEDALAYSSLAPNTPDLVGRLAALGPTTLATMHGSAFHGDGGQALRDLADSYRHRIANVQQPAAA